MNISTSVGISDVSVKSSFLKPDSTKCSNVKITVIEQREVPTRRDPSIQDINFLGMLSMHSYMEINDSRMEDIQIGFWNPLKNLLDDDLKERKRLRKSS